VDVAAFPAAQAGVPMRQAFAVGVFLDRCATAARAVVLPIMLALTTLPAHAADESWHVPLEPAAVSGAIPVPLALSTTLGVPADTAATPLSAPRAGLVAAPRGFRHRAVDWMRDRSLPLGFVTDLLLGAEYGWEVDVDPAGNDEYSVRWTLRFR
jgi:hypothetical protein